MTQRRATTLVCHALFAIAVLAASPAFAQVTAPESHFGFRLGSDRQLASMDAIEQYFKLVASQSDRVTLIDLGPTTEGKPTIAAVVSAPANIKDLARIRANNSRLADPRSLPPEEAKQLASTQKVILAIGASIHASEVGGTQAASELLHSLASATDAETLAVLENVVTVIIPSLNPDGHRLVTEWYAQTKGTRWEGGAMPWLYQKYAGHDINRDAFMLNLAENRNLARFFNGDWHPQVFLTMHQMEDNGPRFFVPPNTDPIDPNSDPLIWRSAALLGGAMAMQMQREGRSGVVTSAKYDYYWPGFEDSAPIGHNTVCLLTEVASVDIATPVTVPATELRAGFKGLQDYRPQINFPDPWPGGRWTLRDIVDYDLSAVRGLLFAASAYRSQLVQNFYDMGSRAIAKGRDGGPFAFIITPEQRDAFTAAKLESLLIDGGVEIQRALEPFRADGEPYPEGTDIVFMAQPYRAFAKTLLEVQRYPARRVTPNGPPERPYDVAGWTLPLQMGVNVVTIERSFQPPSLTRLTAPTIAPGAIWGERRPTYWVMEARGNGAALALNRLVAAGATPMWTTRPIEGLGFTYPSGSFVVPYARTLETAMSTVTAAFGLRAEGMKGKVPTDGLQAIGRARVALYKPWTASIDEGWTRFLLEKFEFKFDSITDRDLRAGNLRDRFDVIILPNAPADRLTTGAGDGSVPPEYAGGMGNPGLDALKAFVQGGGSLVCLGASAAIPIGTFDLPLRDVARDQDRLFVPGSIVKLTLDPTQPLAYGLPQETAAFFAFSSVYVPLGGGTAPGASANGSTSNGAAGGTPAPRANVRPIARYGDRDVLLSGWLEGEDLIAGKTAIAEAEVGTGRVVLFGFPVQHRAQSYATFRLLFNALFSAPQAAIIKQR